MTSLTPIRSTRRGASCDAGITASDHRQEGDGTGERAVAQDQLQELEADVEEPEGGEELGDDAERAGAEAAAA